MIDEIVKALRELDADKPNPWDVCYEAADEIERLTSERDALRALLREAREWLFFTCDDDPADLYARIDALLNKEGE